MECGVRRSGNGGRAVLGVSGSMALVAVASAASLPDLASTTLAKACGRFYMIKSIG